MGMYLGLGLYAAVNVSEGRYSPVKVVLSPVSSAERQLFAESSFIDLYDTYTVSFKVEHLLAYGKSDLQGALPERYILSREGPVEYGDRSCEHTLHGLVGQALSVYRPPYCHGLCS